MTKTKRRKTQSILLSFESNVQRKIKLIVDKLNINNHHIDDKDEKVNKVNLTNVK